MFSESFVLMWCLKHIVCPQLLDKNWQTWNYQLRKCPLYTERSVWYPYRLFSMDDDYYFWVHLKTIGTSCTVIDRKTMAVKCVSMTASNDITPVDNHKLYCTYGRVMVIHSFKLHPSQHTLRRFIIIWSLLNSWVPWNFLMLIQGNRWNRYFLCNDYLNWRIFIFFRYMKF